MGDSLCIKFGHREWHFRKIVSLNNEKLCLNSLTSDGVTKRLFHGAQTHSWLVTSGNNTLSVRNYKSFSIINDSSQGF